MEGGENKHIVKHILDFLCYYGLPGVALIYLVGGIFASYNTYSFLVLTGLWAFILVAIILFVKPLSVFFHWPPLLRIVGYRRELGVLSFWLAVFHGAGLLIRLEIFSAENIHRLTNINGPMLPGFIALIGMILLGITSNRISQMKLARHWKHVQYLAYPTFLFIALHYYRVDDNIIPMGIFGLYVLLKIIEYIVHKRRMHPSRTEESYPQHNSSQTLQQSPPGLIHEYPPQAAVAAQ